MALYQPTPPSKFKQIHGQIRTLLEQELIPGGIRRTNIYSHQIQASLATMHHFLDRPIQNQRPVPPALIVCPTGSGKSGIIALLPYVLCSTKVLVLSPSPTISEQLKTTLGADGLAQCFFFKTGLIGDNEQRQNCLEDVKLIRSVRDIPGMDSSNLVIVNAQKFGGNSGMSLTNDAVVDNVRVVFQAFSTIIVDEAHHYPATTWRNIVDNFANKQIVFLTATPFRQDRPILENQSITYTIEREAIEGVVIRRSEFEEVPWYNHNDYFAQAQAMTLVNQRIEQYLDMHDRQIPEVVHKALILVRTKEEAAMYTHQFPSSTYFTSDPTTQDNLTLFERGAGYRKLIICGKLLEGYDNHTISVCVILRKVGAKVTFAQFIGRCLRMSRPDDNVIAKVISVANFCQKDMWDEYRTPRIAENDPTDDQDV